MTPSATLITFPPSLDCELSRFLLIHYRIHYEERPHAFIFNGQVFARGTYNASAGGVGTTGRRAGKRRKG